MAHPDPGDGKTETTFGISMKTTTDSDITGRVVEDCVRWMSGHALHREGLFTDPGHVDGKKLLALRKAYEAGKRPLRRSCGPHDPLTVANFLLLWLSSLPTPPVSRGTASRLMEAAAQAPGAGPGRQELLRRALRGMDGAAQDTLYALFEFLHHHWINQRDRRQALCQLARLFGPLVVGARRGATPAQPACHAALEATAALIADFRRLFVQPMKLQRYLADLDLPDECGEAGAGATDTSSETADATSGLEQESCPDPELVAVLDGMLGDILGVSLAGAAKAAKEPWSPTGIADAGAFELDGMSESSSFSSAEDGEEDSPQRRLWGSRGGCVAGGPPLRLVV